MFSWRTKYLSFSMSVLWNTQFLDSYTQPTYKMSLTDIICYTGDKRYTGTFELNLLDQR